MAVAYTCDGCGRTLDHARVNLTSHGFEWGNRDEHYCSGACLVGRLNASAGVENLLREYARNCERAPREAGATTARKPEAGRDVL